MENEKKNKIVQTKCLLKQNRVRAHHHAEEKKTGRPRCHPDDTSKGSRTRKVRGGKVVNYDNVLLDMEDTGIVLQDDRKSEEKSQVMETV